MSQDLCGLVGHGSRAALTELLQPRPGEEQDSLLGEQVSAPEGGDGTQGSHLNTLTGGSQVADEQLQHSLTVEEATLFDEVLHLLSAQEGVLPLGHSLDQAQLLLAVTQGHSLNPFCQVIRCPAGPRGAVAARPTTRVRGLAQIIVLLGRILRAGTAVQLIPAASGLPRLVSRCWVPAPGNTT